MPNLQRRVSIRIKHLRGILERSLPSCIHEFLEEHFPEHAVRLLLEDRAEDHGDAVVRRLDVDRFFVPVVDLHELALGPGGTVGGCGGGFEGVLRGEGAFEGRGEGVALEQGDGLDQCGLFL